MRKFLLGAVALAAIAAPLALSVSAEAVTTQSSATECVPVFEKAAVAEVNHIEYKYKPAVGNGHIKWSTENVQTRNFDGVAYVRDGVKTQVVIDSPAVAAVDGVTCVIDLPANPLTGINGVGPNTVVPTPVGTDKYTFSAVTNHITLNGRIGTTITAEPGYVFSYGGKFLTSKVFAATPDNSGFVFVTKAGISTATGAVPVVFAGDTREFDNATYQFVQVAQTIVNDTDQPLTVAVMTAEQQEGNLLWIERTVFSNWRHDIFIPAHSSEVVKFDVWHDVAGGSVPTGLTLRFAVDAH